MDNKRRFAEKLAHLEHEKWARNRKQPSEELAVRALRLLDKTAGNPVDADDTLKTEDGSASAERLSRQAAPRMGLTEFGPSAGSR